MQRESCVTVAEMTKTFMLNDRYRACQAGIKAQVVEMAINGSERYPRYGTGVKNQQEHDHQHVKKKPTH